MQTGGTWGYFRLQTDGSHNEHGLASICGTLWASRNLPQTDMLNHEWIKVGSFAAVVEATSAFEAELQAMAYGLAFIMKLLAKTNGSFPVHSLNLQAITNLLRACA